ncbi:hypothetical protein GON03_14420 [Nocardioides sp. MAH-18]|uniref:TPM domain-containing protein n=1 Tax=Nocardioides agri TaxID=2682843 RepID=A0A6L6XUS1_9ACTN|nr:MULTISPECIES: hypothetical protein [unclassified Nocardioides]MBA2955527.1 hypothetical protein [Nocardioides sp. CGMCC 1.13656]MVQ50377.1 hypothetical protein [Nocardioides sp. MAH-18]
MNTLIALAVPVAALVAYLATAPASAARTRREAARRDRRVTRHPSLATLGDVQRRLADELPGSHADFVLARVDRHHIDPKTLWTWLDRFGAESLVLALASGQGYTGMLRVLRDELEHDVAEATVLARLSEPELFQLAAVAAPSRRTGTCSRLPG